MNIGKLASLLVVVRSGSSLEDTGEAYRTDVLQVGMDCRGISQERGGGSEKNSEISMCSVVE